MDGIDMGICSFLSVSKQVKTSASLGDAVIFVITLASGVDASKCIGCGKCADACPKNLIGLTPKDKKVAVRCSNPAKGIEVKNVCTAGCLGCTLCTRKCEEGAITMNGNLPVVDYDKCIGCGKCADACPRGIIARFNELAK